MLRPSADVGAPQKIVEPAHAVPTIAVALDDQMMLSIIARPAVLGSQQIDKNVAMLSPRCRSEGDLVRLSIKVMDKQHRVVAPVVPHHQERGVAHRNDREIAPPDLWHLFAHANNAFGPIQQRLWIAALNGSV